MYKSENTLLDSVLLVLIVTEDCTDWQRYSSGFPVNNTVAENLQAWTRNANGFVTRLMATLEEIKALKDARFLAALSVVGRNLSVNSGQGHGLGNNDFRKTDLYD